MAKRRPAGDRATEKKLKKVATLCDQLNDAVFVVKADLEEGFTRDRISSWKKLLDLMDAQATGVFGAASGHESGFETGAKVEAVWDAIDRTMDVDEIKLHLGIEHSLEFESIKGSVDGIHDSMGTLVRTFNKYSDALDSLI